MGTKKRPQKEIDWVIEWYARGLLATAIVEKFQKKFGRKLNVSTIRDIVHKHKNDYEFDKVDTEKIRQTKEREELIKLTCEFIKENNRMPLKDEFDKKIMKFTLVRREFDSLIKFETYLRKNHGVTFEDIIDEKLFTKKNFLTLRQKVNKSNVFVITTAVTNCEPSIGLKTLKSYCEHRNGELLIVPCSDPAKKFQKKNGGKKWRLHPDFKDENIVFRDLRINKNLFISTIKMSAKQLQPLTGLKRIAQREGSMICASPKLFLDYVSFGNSKDKRRAIMTTGGITVPDYESEYYMSGRTEYFANHDHSLGAVIVEVVDDKTFHFRQIQIEPETGIIYDINKKYYPDGRVEDIRGTKETPVLLRLPDYHVTETDPVAKANWKEICELTQPVNMSVEDFFNGTSINHWDKNNMVIKSKKAVNGEASLEDELSMCADEMNDLLTWPCKNLVYIWGNHELFLTRWLDSAEYAKDGQELNHHLGVKLADQYLEGKNPLRWALEEHIGIDNKEKLIWLTEDDSFKPSGTIENGVHGHIGRGGTRTSSLAVFEEIYGPCTVMHNHTPGWFRDVVRGGTSTYCDSEHIGYIKGLSITWMQACVLEHCNGSRQIINVIDGTWTTNKEYFL